MLEIIQNHEYRFFIAGHVFPNGKFAVFRENKPKSYVPKYVYNESKWGKFIHGATYFITPQTVIQLYEFAICLPSLLFIEDVLFTGILASKLNISRLSLNEFYELNLNSIHPGFQLSRNFSRYSNIAIYHGKSSFSSREMHSVWQALNKYHLI